MLEGRTSGQEAKGGRNTLMGQPKGLATNSTKTSTDLQFLEN